MCNDWTFSSFISMPQLLEVIEVDYYLCIVTEKAEKDFLSILLDSGTIPEEKACILKFYITYY